MRSEDITISDAVSRLDDRTNSEGIAEADGQSALCSREKLVKSSGLTVAKSIAGSGVCPELVCHSGGAYPDVY